jgi:hypothetical protein
MHATVQCLDFAPDGSAMPWISTQWGRDASTSSLMVAQFFDVVPDGGAMLQFCA